MTFISSGLCLALSVLALLGVALANEVQQSPSATVSIPPLPSGTGICTNGGNPAPRYPLRVASGWRAGAVLTGLRSPRGLTMDKEGHLLIVQRGAGVSAHTIGPDGCILSSTLVVNQTDLNHGIVVSPDGGTLYASSPEAAFKWTYNGTALTATGRVTLITGMNGGHNTRTLLIPAKNPGILVVSRGSRDNLDIPSYQAATGRAIVKVYNISEISKAPVDYSASGKVLAYGLRNDVGLVEDGAGNIWSVENSADNLQRASGATTTDVHNDNPAELLWNLGNPSNPSGFFGGYPYCFMIWGSALFRGETVSSGNWFVQQPNATVNDAWCNTITGKKPSLLLPPHSAPLDIKWGYGSDTAAYVSLHGSWNRDPPQGYKVVRVPGKFSAEGAWAPDAPVSSTSGFTQFLWNTDESKCTTGCFRPVGLQWDKEGNNLYVASDTSGELFLIRKETPTSK